MAIMFCETLGAQAFSDLHKPTASNPWGLVNNNPGPDFCQSCSSSDK